VAVPVKLLLVEDLPQLRGVVMDLLSTVGDFALVHAASTEAEANLWLDENAGNWDLAVIDLILEQGTGLGVVARARNRTPGSKVVVFSDYATKAFASTASSSAPTPRSRRAKTCRAFSPFAAPSPIRAPAASPGPGLRQLRA
jgi:two-component system OmpR family response regulator